MVVFWDVFVTSLWLVDATKACNLVSIGGLFPDGAKALPEPSSMPYLLSTVTIELNVVTHVSGMSKINPVMLLCLFWDCRSLTLCILELAPVVNWVLTIEFMSALRTCDLNLHLHHESAWSGPVNWMVASRMPQLYPVMLQCLFWKGRPLIFL